MKLTKTVEINVSHEEVDESIMGACAFDKLAMMNRMAKTITKEDVEDVKKYFQECSAPLHKQIIPLIELVELLKKE